jgi:hypothetical protein
VSGSDEDLNADARAAIRWTRTQLDEAARAFLAALPLTRREGDILYVHANAWAPGARAAFWVRSRPSAACAGQMRVTLCGHLHAPA